MDATAELVLQCRNLNNQCLYSSAASLAAFAAGSSQQDAEVFVVYGNALFGLCEYKRALPAYRSAFELQGVDKDADSSDLLWKMAECHRLIGDFNAQLSTLETIPVQCRTPAINIALGKLYQRFNIESVAIACFQEALAACPLAIEAVEPLALMNVKEQDILSRVSKHGSHFSWLVPLVTARIQAAQGDHKTAMQNLKPMVQLYPENSELSCNLGLCQLELGLLEEAAHSFAQARALEAHYIKDMDRYAQALLASGEAGVLNQLTHALLDTSVNRPEGWLAGSLYMQLKDDRDRALEYAEKAIQVDPKCAEGHVRKGALLLDRGQFDPALAAFRKALESRKSVSAYQGAVRAYIGLERVKEALSSAKEALQRMPRSGKAFSLVGLALSQLPQGLDKAKVALDRARQFNPACSETTSALVDVLLQQERAEEAAEVLLSYLHIRDRDDMRARLGDVYVKIHKYDLALNEYHKALALNPRQEVAKKGLEKLESVIKSDPAAAQPAQPEEEEEDDPDDI